MVEVTNTTVAINRQLSSDHGNNHVAKAASLKALVEEQDVSASHNSLVALDEGIRHQMIQSFTRSAEAFETPYDTMMRLFDATRQVSVIVIGGNLGVFKTLAETVTPLSSAQLAEVKSADPVLVARILRHMVSNGIVKQAGPDQFLPNQTTIAYANPDTQRTFRWLHHVNGPAIQNLPDLLEETGYKNEPKKNSFQRAFNTDLDMYSWLKERPGWMRDFSAVMHMYKQVDSMHLLPVDEASTKGFDTVLVDIGGNTGQQAIEVLSETPQLAGKLIVQDRGEVIDTHPDVKGIHWQAHDFFTQQPVYGKL